MALSVPQILSTTPRTRRTQLSLTKFISREHHRCAHISTTSVISRRRKKPIFNRNQTIRSNQFAALALATATIMTSKTTYSMANAFVLPKPVGTKNGAAPTEPSSLVQHANKIFEFEKIESKMYDESSSISIGTTAATSWTSPEDYQYSLRKILNIPDNSCNPTAEEVLHRFPKVVGHRGCIYEEFENTREGFSRCHDIGCDSVELDVFKVNQSKRNEEDTSLVVFHGGGTDENPGDLFDYCGIDGSILDYSYEDEIRGKLMFNPEYTEFPCPIEKIRQGQVPTLEQVLLDAKHKNNSKLKQHRKMEIKIELKGPDVVDDVLELVDSLGVASMCSFSSFDLQKIKRVRELKPDRDPNTGKYLYKTGALFNCIDTNGMILDSDYSPIHSVSNWNKCDVVDRAVAVGASEVHLKYDTCTKQLIDRIHAQGLGSMAWFRGPIGMREDCLFRYKDVGNEDFTMYEAVLQTGVQQMCVNKPDVLIALREKYLLQYKMQQMQQMKEQQRLLDELSVLRKRPNMKEKRSRIHNPIKKTYQ